MIPDPPCLLCASEDWIVEHEGARHAPDAEVRRCTSCGLVYLVPRPTQDELDAYYAGDYRREYDNPSLEELLPEARDRVHRLESLLHPEARVLDVGSGAGAFLHAVAPHVKDAIGVEPGGGTTLGDADGRFDVIVLFHVLEHLADPVAFLKELRGRLTPGGAIVVEVPNIDDVLVSTYDLPEYRTFYFQKAHLFYFSPTTLAATFEAAGLDVHVTGIQRYDLSNHLEWARTGRPGGSGRYAFLRAADRAYADALVAAGLSDTLWAVGRER